MSHDEALIRKAAQFAHDQEALVDLARKGRAEIENVLGEDVRNKEIPTDHAWEAPDRTRE